MMKIERERVKENGSRKRHGKNKMTSNEKNWEKDRGIRDKENLRQQWWGRECEREREKKIERKKERDYMRKREIVCVWEREKERVTI